MDLKLDNQQTKGDRQSVEQDEPNNDGSDDMDVEPGSSDGENSSLSGPAYRRLQEWKQQEKSWKSKTEIE